MSAKSNNFNTKAIVYTDTSGLPLDLWRNVLSYLPVADLCHCSQVCRSWAYLVKSLDITAWKKFYFSSNEWKHPNWPRDVNDDEVCKPWRTLYREHKLATRWWSLCQSQLINTPCFTTLRKKKDRRVIHVGPTKLYTTLRSALNIATEYDSIRLHAGLYDEQFEMSSKIPFELIGDGEPGSVILMMSIEQVAATGRLCNLMLKAPWFTEHILKVSTGHLQVDNCHIEDGEVTISHPATVHFRYCTFSRVHLQFNHVSISAIENCELRQSTVFVDGYPKESLNWSHGYLLKWAQSWINKQEEESDDSYYQLYEAKILEDGSTVTSSDISGTSSTFEVNKSEVDSIGVASIDCQSCISNQGSDSDFSSESGTLITSDSSSFNSDDDNESDPEMILSSRLGQLIVTEPESTKGLTRSTTRNDILVSIDQDQGHKKWQSKAENKTSTVFISECDTNNMINTSSETKPDLVYTGSTTETVLKDTKLDSSSIVKTNGLCAQVPAVNNQNINPQVSKELFSNYSQVKTDSKNKLCTSGQSTVTGQNQPYEKDDDQTGTLCMSAIQQMPSVSISSRSRLTSETLPLLDVLEQSSESSDNSSNDTDSSPDVSEFMKGKQGRISPLWSSDSESLLQDNFEKAFSDVLKQDMDLINMIYNTQGPIFRSCLFHGGQGGLKVSQQGQCCVKLSEFKDLQYGIRCLQNAKVAIFENNIHHCQTSGIFMRLAAHGIILRNDIYCTNEAGIDVRRNADPLIQCNRIHHCKRSGIAVLGAGCGLIKGNDIYQNREAGVYILYKGNPYIVENRICRGGAAGIAVNENGYGYILDNYISNNRWGGIDIRNGSEPTVCRNVICNGLADGIVVGYKGKCVIEGNTVKGNDGCGIWIMGGQPLIQMNQIYNNNDTGIAFALDREVARHDHDSDSLSETSDVDVGISYETTSMKSHVSIHVPQLRFNTIFHNNGYGILSCHSESLTFYGNAIHDNKNVGILVKQEESVEILGNSITFNLGAGIQIGCQSKATIEGNGIYENKENGLVIGGEASVLQNDIFCNDLNALLMTQKALVKVENNRIHAPVDTAVKATETAQGQFIDNQVYSGHGKVFDLSKKSLLNIAHNDILEKSHDQNGLHLQDWHLENPPPRPHIHAPPQVVPQAPNKCTSMVTRVVVPSTGPCQQSSKFCAIL